MRVLDYEALGDSTHLTGLKAQFGGGRTSTCGHRCEDVLHRNGTRLAVAVAYLGIDEYLGTLSADVGIVDKDTTSRHAVLLNGIGNGDFVLGNEPHVTIDTPMISEVECHLLLARRVRLVVAIVGTDGDD